VQWYLACNLSRRDLKEIMAGHGITIGHSTVHRWLLHFGWDLLERFHRRKRAVKRK
jgi:transposase-like protein